MFRPSLVDGPGPVAEDDLAGSGGQQKFADGDPRSPGPVHDHRHVGKFPAGELQGVQDAREGDHRRTVLVVVKDRDVELRLEVFLDVEASRGRDVLQVDAPEGGGDQSHRLDDHIGVFGVHADGESVDAGEALEEDAFPLHHGQRRVGADVAEAQNGGAVGDDGHHVALAGNVIYGIGIPLDLPAGFRHAGRVDQRQVLHGLHGNPAFNGELATVFPVKLKGFPEKVIT